MLDTQNENLKREYENKKQEIDGAVEQLKSFLRNEEIISAKEFIDLQWDAYKLVENIAKCADGIKDLFFVQNLEVKGGSSYLIRNL